MKDFLLLLRSRELSTSEHSHVCSSTLISYTALSLPRIPMHIYIYIYIYIYINTYTCTIYTHACSHLHTHIHTHTHTNTHIYR
jgi:hypothetical protein